MHYVPIQVTYTDLYDVIAFFRNHDEAAAKIAGAGKQWSQKFWRKEDMSAYLYRSVWRILFRGLLQITVVSFFFRFP